MTGIGENGFSTDLPDDEGRAIRERFAHSAVLLTATPPSLAAIEQLADRRRKRRRFQAGATFLSAAAAVVAVILAVTFLGDGRTDRDVRPVRPSPSPSSQGPSPSASGSPSTAPSSSAPAAFVGPRGVAMPKDFKAWSVSFIDASHGWALGDAQCAGKPTLRCMSIARTTDGGESWAAIPTPAGLTADESSCYAESVVKGPCVSNLVFANPLDGYAYSENAMFMTADGGATWQPVGSPTTNGAVAVVATTSVVARLVPLLSCEGGCPTALEVAPLGSNIWRDVTPEAAKQSDTYAPLDSIFTSLVARGTTLTLVTELTPRANNTRSVLTSVDGGATWVKKTSSVYACDLDASFDVAPDGSITGICHADTPYVVSQLKGAGTTTNVGVSSRDGGATFAPIAGLPSLRLNGGTKELWVSVDWFSAASAATLFVGESSTDGVGNYRSGSYATFDGGRSWRELEDGNSRVPSARDQLPHFVTPDFGFWATDPTGTSFPSQFTTVRTTTDGGHTWVKHTIG